MIENSHNPARTDTDTSRKHGDARISRTIRFSDAEWEQVEKAASSRGDSPAEFVRNAALATATGDSGSDPRAMPPGIVNLIADSHQCSRSFSLNVACAFLAPTNASRRAA